MDHRSLAGSLRRHLSYSNLVATLALFIALGGVSYAAVKIPAKSVGTKQLKKGAVGTKQLKKRAVGIGQLKPDSVTSTQVKNGSLLAEDFKAGELGAEARRYRGPLVNRGADPSGSGWQKLQTVTGKLSSGLYAVELFNGVDVECPAGPTACEVQAALRINGDLATGSAFAQDTPGGQTETKFLFAFGYYPLTGTTTLEMVWKQVAGPAATVTPQSGNNGPGYFVEPVNELNQAVP